MASYIPENYTDTNPNQMSTFKNTPKSGLFLEKTKLEAYVDILAMVSKSKRFKQKSIYEDKGVIVIREHSYALDFLTELNLIEQKQIGKTEIKYTVTPRGSAVLKYFRYFDSLKKTKIDN
jgi:predicted transcriptional regulator